jgi:hypothetical protein
MPRLAARERDRPADPRWKYVCNGAARFVDFDHNLADSVRRLREYDRARELGAADSVLSPIRGNCALDVSVARESASELLPETQRQRLDDGAEISLYPVDLHSPLTAIEKTAAEVLESMRIGKRLAAASARFEKAVAWYREVLATLRDFVRRGVEERNWPIDRSLLLKICPPAQLHGAANERLRHRAPAQRTKNRRSSPSGKVRARLRATALPTREEMSRIRKAVKTAGKRANAKMIRNRVPMNWSKLLKGLRELERRGEYRGFRNRPKGS